MITVTLPSLRFKTGDLIQTIPVAAFVLYGLQYFWGLSTLRDNTALMQILMYASFGILLAGILFVLVQSDMVPLKRIGLMLLVTGTMVYVYAVIPYSIYAVSLAFVAYILLCGKRLDKDRLLKTLSVILMALLLGIMAAALIHIIPNIVMSGNRYCLGLQNYNMGFYFFNAAALTLYTMRKRHYWAKMGILFVINTMIYYYTKTRMPFLLITILLLLFVWADFLRTRPSESLGGYGRKFSDKRWYRWFLGGYFPIMLAFIFLASKFYNPGNAVFRILNSILTGRLGFQQRNMANFGYSLFPRFLQYGTWQVEGGEYVVYIDSGYLDLFVRFGFLVTVIILSLYTMLLWQAGRSGNRRLVCWLFCVGLFNIINNSFMNIFMDTSILMLLAGKELYTDERFRNACEKVKAQSLRI